MPLDATAIEFRAVSYGVNGRPIVSDVSLRIASGETLVLLGRSGSGKTTLLRLINRMLVPTRGEVVVDGVVTTAWDAIRLRRHIGYVIQEGGLFPHLDRKSTRLNSSHGYISYAVFCLKKKNLDEWCQAPMQLLAPPQLAVPFNALIAPPVRSNASAPARLSHSLRSRPQCGAPQRMYSP